MNHELYRELYEVTLKIKAMEPWNYFYDMDLITILLPDYDEPVYCSIMGRGGQYYGIGIYPGFYPLQCLSKIAEGKIPQHQLIRYNNNLKCTFGNRDELSKEQYNLIKELGFKFRGKNNWIYFESNVKGYVPTMLNEGEAEFLLDVFKNLYMAIKKYLENDIEVDFEHGEILVRRYDEESKLWYTHAGPLIMPELIEKTCVIDDELLIARLNKKKCNNTQIEIDTVYLYTPITDKKYDVPVFPRITICADISSGMIINQNMSTVVDSDEGNEIMNMFLSYIENYERPRIVFVRDEFIKSILQDTCEKLKIELMISEKMKIIDEFAESFMEFRGI